MYTSQAYASAFKKLLTFDGRASRSEFWQVYPVFLLIVVFVHFFSLFFLDAFYKPARDQCPLQVIYLFFLSFGVSLFISFCHLPLLVRRFHDTGLSGILAIPAIFPPFSLLIVLICCIRAGDKGDNRFGPDPLANNS